MGKIIDIATAEMIRIAIDNSFGYSQEADERMTVSRDCSSNVILAWEKAGIPVFSKYGATYTGNMKPAFLKAGFIDVTRLINLITGEGLIKGDVLLRTSGHTAGCIGRDELGQLELVQAQSNEKGTTMNGVKGDQTGREIFIKNYYNSPWDVILRYPEVEERPVTPVAPVAPVTPVTPTTPVTLNHKIGEDVVFSTCYNSSTAPNEKAIDASKMKVNHGKITKIYQGAKNPYLLNGDMCFVNDGDIRGLYVAPVVAPVTPKPAPVATWSVGSKLHFGDRSSDVYEVALALEKQGYGVSLVASERSAKVARYGDNMKIAVKKFQTKYPETGTRGEVDYIVGEKVVEKLGGKWIG